MPGQNIQATFVPINDGGSTPIARTTPNINMETTPPILNIQPNPSLALIPNLVGYPKEYSGSYTIPDRNVVTVSPRGNVEVIKSNEPTFESKVINNLKDQMPINQPSVTIKTGLINSSTPFERYTPTNTSVYVPTVLTPRGRMDYLSNVIQEKTAALKAFDPYITYRYVGEPEKIQEYLKADITAKQAELQYNRENIRDLRANVIWQPTQVGSLAIDEQNAQHNLMTPISVPTVLTPEGRAEYLANVMVENQQKVAELKPQVVREEFVGTPEDYKKYVNTIESMNTAGGLYYSAAIEAAKPRQITESEKFYVSTIGLNPNILIKEVEHGATKVGSFFGYRTSEDIINTQRNVDVARVERLDELESMSKPIVDLSNYGLPGNIATSLLRQSLTTAMFVSPELRTGVDIFIQNPLTAMIPIGAGAKIGTEALETTAVYMGTKVPGTVGTFAAGLGTPIVRNLPLIKGLTPIEAMVGGGFAVQMGADVLSSKSIEEGVGKTVAIGVSLPGAGIGVKSVEGVGTSVAKDVLKRGETASIGFVEGTTRMIGSDTRAELLPPKQTESIESQVNREIERINKISQEQYGISQPIKEVIYDKKFWTPDYDPRIGVGLSEPYPGIIEIPKTITSEQMPIIAHEGTHAMLRTSGISELLPGLIKSGKPIETLGLKYDTGEFSKFSGKMEMDIFQIQDVFYNRFPSSKPIEHEFAYALEERIADIKMAEIHTPESVIAAKVSAFDVLAKEHGKTGFETLTIFDIPAGFRGIISSYYPTLRFLERQANISGNVELAKSFKERADIVRSDILNLVESKYLKENIRINFEERGYPLSRSITETKKILQEFENPFNEPTGSPYYTNKQYVKERLKDTYRTEPTTISEQYGSITNTRFYREGDISGSSGTFGGMTSAPKYKPGRETKPMEIPEQYKSALEFGEKYAKAGFQEKMDLVKDYAETKAAKEKEVLRSKEHLPSSDIPDIPTNYKSRYDPYKNQKATQFDSLGRPIVTKHEPIPQKSIEIKSKRGMAQVMERETIIRDIPDSLKRLESVREVTPEDMQKDYAFSKLKEEMSGESRGGNVNEFLLQDIRKIDDKMSDIARIRKENSANVLSGSGGNISEFSLKEVRALDDKMIELTRSKRNLINSINQPNRLIGISRRTASNIIPDNKIIDKSKTTPDLFQDISQNLSSDSINDTTQNIATDVITGTKNTQRPDYIQSPDYFQNVDVINIQDTRQDNRLKEKEINKLKDSLDFNFDDATQQITKPTLKTPVDFKEFSSTTIDVTSDVIQKPKPREDTRGFQVPQEVPDYDTYVETKQVSTKTPKEPTLKPPETPTFPLFPEIPKIPKKKKTEEEPPEEDDLSLKPKKTKRLKDIRKSRAEKPWHPAAYESVTAEEYLTGKKARHIIAKEETELAFRQFIISGTPIPTARQLKYDQKFI